MAGVLIILAACIFAYLSTRPAEADVASLFKSQQQLSWPGWRYLESVFL
jgi:hypothetical protein